MKYTGFYTNGPDHDPRTKYFAKYECEECGHQHNDVQSWAFRSGKFMPKYDMKCQACGSYGLTDEAKVKQIKDEIESLTQNKSNIEIRIDSLIGQLNNLTDPVDTSYEDKRKKSLLWNS